MKNINLASHSSMPVKVSRGKKPFILVSLFLLMLIAVASFSLYVSSDKQGHYKLVTKIGSVFTIEKPKKLIKIALSNRSSEGEKPSKPQSREQMAGENINKAETEKEGLISEETDSEPAVTGNEDLTKTDTFTVETYDKSVSTKAADIKIAASETEKEALTEAENKQQGVDEDIKQLEGALKTTSRYYLQVCSCVIKDNADKIFRKLGDQGYSPLMEEIVRHVRMHNIYTEDFAKKSEALELFNRLKNDGFDSALLPSSDSGYRIRITSCFYLESAKRVIKRLKHLGYETKIHKEFIPTKMYSVLLGNFESLQEAEAASQRLIKMGYPHPILKHNPKT